MALSRRQVSYELDMFSTTDLVSSCAANSSRTGSVGKGQRRIDRWELVTVLRGRFDVLIFTSDGVVKSRVVLGSQGASVAEIAGGEWHSVVFHAPAAVVLEVKAGPYEPQLDKEFASWAPPENDPAAARFVSWLETAAPGDAVSRQ